MPISRDEVEAAGRKYNAARAALNEEKKELDRLKALSDRTYWVYKHLEQVWSDQGEATAEEGA